MRLLSWNINGIRTLPQYHPWNTLKTCEAILGELGADIICFQEMKSSRSALERHVAIPPSYDAFFSFPTAKGGYSGVAVYTKSQAVVPLKVEEGLSGKIQPKVPLAEHERISRSYPTANDIALVPDEQGITPIDLLDLDKEGRGLIIDFGLFVLINLYCPNETSDARLPYKLNYHLMLEARVRRLVQEGREVIVTGDMNICAAPLDHCDGILASRANEFWEHPARAWYREWLAPRGPMVDVIRDCWPERQGMFTCWNTKISARESNYGTRIDYFLLTKGLLPWFKHGDIRAAVKGSDHCPIYIDLHDEIITESGETLTLRTAMGMTGPPREAPRIAAKNWDEFSGKQKLLSTFFGKKAEDLPRSQPKLPEIEFKTPGPTLTPTVLPLESHDSKVQCIASSPSLPEIPAPPRASVVPSEPTEPNLAVPPESSVTVAKRKKMQVDSNYPAQPAKRLKKQKTGQMQLFSFFAKSAPSSSTETQDAETQDEDIYTQPKTDGSECDDQILNQIQADNELAQQLSMSQEASATPAGKVKGENAWSQLFAPLKPPKCTVHGEPTKELTVNKPGPNKGKTFFICSRPLGPGYDAGKSHRLREEVDPQYRCNFFKWSSDVKRESMRAQKG